MDIEEDPTKELDFKENKRELEKKKTFEQNLDNLDKKKPQNTFGRKKIRERNKNIDDCMIFQEADDKIQTHDITIWFFNKYFNVQECTPGRRGRSRIASEKCFEPG